MCCHQQTGRKPGQQSDTFVWWWWRGNLLSKQDKKPWNLNQTDNFIFSVNAYLILFTPPMTVSAMMPTSKPCACGGRAAQRFLREPAWQQAIRALMKAPAAVIWSDGLQPVSIMILCWFILLRLQRRFVLCFHARKCVSLVELCLGTHYYTPKMKSSTGVWSCIKKVLNLKIWHSNTWNMQEIVGEGKKFTDMYEGYLLQLDADGVVKCENPLEV